MPIEARGEAAAALVWQFGGPEYVFATDGWVTRDLWQMEPPSADYDPTRIVLDHTTLSAMVDDEFRRWLLAWQRGAARAGRSGPPRLVPDDWRYDLVVMETREDVRSYVRAAAGRLRAQLWPPKPLSADFLRAERARLEAQYLARLQDPSSFVNVTGVY